MEGNRDESIKCIKIAEKCARSGHKDKAIKFLYKAERLYPSNRAKELLAELESMNGSAASGSDDPAGASSGPTPNGHSAGASGSTDTTDGENTARKRTTSGGSGQESVKNYSQKQLEEVRKIRKCKDYYEILGVSKDCSEDDLKKSYKKLALKFHPDKNHAPGATEAFKAIGNAMSVLSDSEKRRRYDQFGNEEDRPSHRHSHGGFYEYDYSRGFEGDISAEELFNMFFGGGFQTSHMHHHRPQRRPARGFSFHSGHNQQQTEPAYTLLLQLAPILFLVLLSLLSSFLVSDPLFSLERTQKYNSLRETQNLNVQYYVKSDFHTEYKGSVRRLEQQVEEEYLSSLRANCFRERSYKENLLWRARNYNDAKLYARAQDMKTPSCDKLNQIYS